jgi:hypothetical protein
MWKFLRILSDWVGLRLPFCEDSDPLISTLKLFC